MWLALLGLGDLTLIHILHAFRQRRYNGRVIIYELFVPHDVNLTLASTHTPDTRK